VSHQLIISFWLLGLFILLFLAVLQDSFVEVIFGSFLGLVSFLFGQLFGLLVKPEFIELSPFCVSSVFPFS
jgi:hypothetical protein